MRFVRYVGYVLYGSALIGLLGAAEYRGWSFLRVNEVRNVPRSVRNNPGAYRSPYSGGGRYMRGK
jgi:hypothetical protein